MIRQVRTRTTVARTLSNLATGPKGTYPQPMSTHLSLLPNCRASGALCIQDKFSCLFAGFSIQKRSNRDLMDFKLFGQLLDFFLDHYFWTTFSLIILTLF